VGFLLFKMRGFRIGEAILGRKVEQADNAKQARDVFLIVVVVSFSIKNCHPERSEGPMRKSAKITLISFVCFFAVFGAGYAFLRFVGLADPNACISENRMTIPDLSGIKVEVVDTNCDILAKQESIDVYFSQAKQKSWFAKLRNHRELVFSYDPGRPDDPLPTITHSSDSTILISVPEISSVIRQSRNWEKISIAYDLGKVDYPAN